MLKNFLIWKKSIITLGLNCFYICLKKDIFRLCNELRIEITNYEMKLLKILDILILSIKQIICNIFSKCLLFFLARVISFLLLHEISYL